MKFNPTDPQPGRYTDVPIEVYHASPGVSRSTLMALANGTPKACKHYMENPPEQTPAMALGSAVDLLVTEPHRAADALAVQPAFGRSNADIEAKREWFDRNASKLLLTAAQHEEATRIAAAALDGMRNEGITSLGSTQESWYFRHEGVLAKARPDGYDEATGTTYDLKTARSLVTRDLNTSSVRYGYDVQAAMNSLACEALGLPWTKHVMIVVDEAAPHDVRVIEWARGSAWMELGEVRAIRLLRQFGACLVTRSWPGHRGSDLPMEKWVAIKLEKEIEAEKRSRSGGYAA